MCCVCVCQVLKARLNLLVSSTQMAFVFYRPTICVLCVCADDVIINSLIFTLYVEFAKAKQHQQNSTAASELVFICCTLVSMPKKSIFDDIFALSQFRSAIRFHQNETHRPPAPCRFCVRLEIWYFVKNTFYELKLAFRCVFSLRPSFVHFF